MKVLIVGATGLIGSAISSRLLAEGHEVVAGARNPPRSRPSLQGIRLDLGALSKPEDWRRLLAGVDAVVNCAGVLQDGPGESTVTVHSFGPAILFEACERFGVRRVIHFSAVGVDRETPTAFSETKRDGDAAFAARDLDWIILRPSVVIGRAAYGGSALLRGLAALPILPVMPGTAPIQAVHLDDVVDTVLVFLKPDAPVRHTVELVGPRAYRFEELVDVYRRWMRWPPARAARVPEWLATMVYRLGDAVARLGWKPPVRTTAQREMIRGAVGDASSLTKLSGITPRNVEKMLEAEPASVQERWFARLYLLKPLVFTIFPLFWIATGIISLGPGRERGVQLVMEGGASETIALLADSLRRQRRHRDRPPDRISPHRAAWALCSVRNFHCVRDHRHNPCAVALVRSVGAHAQNWPRDGLQFGCAGDPGRPLVAYFILKFLHIIGASVLLGTGAGIAFFMLLAHLTRKPIVIAGVARIVVIADFVFTATAVVAQPITGLLLVRSVGYSLTDAWILWSIILYVITGLFWLPVVWMQIRLRDLAHEAAITASELPPTYHRLFWCWFAFGFPAFAAVVIIFWLMI